MRIASMGHVIFAATMVALGITGLIHSEFAAVWQPIPKGLPAHEVMSFLCACFPLTCGVGLLWRGTAALAARVLLVYLLLWTLLMNVPDIYRAHAVTGSWYGFVESTVMVAAVWVLYAWFATDWDRRRFGFATGYKGVRIARVLYGSALIYFGIGHFVYLKQTVADVPAWLPWHMFWAYFTGGTFIVAGLAVLAGVYARLAAALSTLQIGLFVVLVWVPILATSGSRSAFQWSETVISAALTAGAWMVTDSYRNMAWLAVNSACPGSAGLAPRPHSSTK